MRPFGGAAPYTYSLNNVTYQASAHFSGLAPGNYTGWIKDQTGCKTSVNVAIGQNPIAVTYNVTASGSCVANNGSIKLFLTGGIGPYTYSLDGNTYQTSNTFSNLHSGTYTGYVKDSKTCIGSHTNIVVGPNCPPPPFAGTGNAKANSLKIVENDILSVQAYPNPSTTEFTLVLLSSSKEKMLISVTDIMGRKIQQTEINGKDQYKFGHDLHPGIYIVQVVQGSQKRTIKLIKE